MGLFARSFYLTTKGLDSQVVELLSLLDLSLSLKQVGNKVGGVLLGADAVSRGSQLLGQRRLESNSNTVDTLVGLLSGDARESSLHDLVLLHEKILGLQTKVAVASKVGIDARGREENALKRRAGVNVLADLLQLCKGRH